MYIQSNPIGHDPVSGSAGTGSIGLSSAGTVGVGVGVAVGVAVGVSVGGGVSPEQYAKGTEHTSLLSNILNTPMLFFVATKDVFCRSIQSTGL
jgi:hypothetical protein